MKLFYKQILAICFLLALSTSAISWIDEGSGQEGCCGSWGGGGSSTWFYGNTILNLASSLGEDTDEAELIFSEMIKLPYSSLFLIAESGDACQLHNCRSLQSNLVIKIAEAAMKYQEFDSRASKDWWNSIQKIFIGFVAFAGLILGLLNRYRPRD
jgi:hypothetical protein